MYRQRMSRRLIRAVALIAGPWMVLSLFANHAFTAGNSVGAGKRGEGAATISGYTISEVHHNLNAVNPQNIDSVTFMLDDAPADGSTIKIRLVSGGTEWYSCSISGTPATNVTCPTTLPQATLAQSDELTVVAAD
jgi:hypothetical protein